jgi:sialate O-acetylesterase
MIRCPRLIRFGMRGALAAFALAAALVARADVKLATVFSDHMVLQQGASLPVWGWADEGELVVVQYRDQVAQTRAKNGKWQVKLAPMKASARPAVLLVLGNNRVELKNVVVGEVWVASGQSNMQWALRQTVNWQAAAAASTNPNLRLFYVPRVKSPQPVADIQGQYNNAKPAWTVASPETTPDFSAVAYFFGRDLQKALGVPVAIIHTSWGGSPAEVWMSERVLAGNSDYKRDILDAYPAAYKNYEAAKARHPEALAKAKQAGAKTLPQAPREPWRPTELYNSMIHPLIPFAIKGAIWYQGESNAGRAWQYRTLFADMIQNWRKDWGQGSFTFLTVQLAPFTKILPEPADSNWAELREAQILASRNVGNAATVVITDVGEENDIHPQQKEPVGARLALQARKLAYGENLVASGPTFKSASFGGGKATVTFGDMGQGLEARGGELKGFAICGKDGKFAWATAKIVGKDKVELTSAGVKEPVAVRFGWANFPVVNLWNKDGLPANPFRTDNFPVTTQPKPAVTAKAAAPKP